MPSFSSKSQLTSAASGSQLAFADIDLIRGAFKVYDNEDHLINESVNYFVDAQIVYVSSSNKLYQCSLVEADFISIFEDSASFKEYTFPGSGGGSTPDGTISGSQQISDLGFLSSADTSSFVLVSQTSSFITNDATSSFTLVSDFNDITSSLSTFVVYSASNATTASYIDPDFISASAAEAGFGSGGGSEVGGIFIETGSFFATTNDLQVTGSFTVGDGLFKLKEFETTPSAEAGAIYYSASNFYFGVD